MRKSKATPLLKKAASSTIVCYVRVVPVTVYPCPRDGKICISIECKHEILLCDRIYLCMDPYGV